MIQGIGSAPSLASVSLSSSQQARPQVESSLETASPFDIALQIQEVQTGNLKRTLDAQTQILDLLA